MSESYIIAKIGGASHRLDFTHRDWGLLTGKNFVEGQRFIEELGVYEHITVADGIPKGSYVIRRRFQLLEKTESLRRAIERDQDLLQYDYTFSFSARAKSKGSGGESGFRVRELVGYINARPHGYCWLELSQLLGPQSGRVVEWIDMRVRGSIETDELGTLEVHRKRVTPIKRLERLPPFIEFLRAHSEKQVTIEHYD